MKRMTFQIETTFNDDGSTDTRVEKISNDPLTASQTGIGAAQLLHNVTETVKALLIGLPAGYGKSAKAWFAAVSEDLARERDAGSPNSVCRVTVRKSKKAGQDELAGSNG